jgi:hypothetical protein
LFLNVWNSWRGTYIFEHRNNSRFKTTARFSSVNCMKSIRKRTRKLHF